MKYIHQLANGDTIYVLKTNYEHFGDCSDYAHLLVNYCIEKHTICVIYLQKLGTVTWGGPWEEDNKYTIPVEYYHFTLDDKSTFSFRFTENGKLYEGLKYEHNNTYWSDLGLLKEYVKNELKNDIENTQELLDIQQEKINSYNKQMASIDKIEIEN